jgi:hypothetical protein
MRADHEGKNRFFAEQIAPEWRLKYPLEQPPRKIRPGEELLRSSRSTLEQIPPREILLLEEIPG